jgi:hypothetical protein
MAEQLRRPDLREALNAYLREQARAASYRRYDGERAHPLQFDESGFPIRQDGASMVKRVARLLKPF